VKPVKVGDVYGVEAGETVFSIGYPMASDLGVNPKISMGIINGITGVKDDPRMFQVSVPLQPGNSGGPLFDENGGVVGVTTSGLNVAYYMKVRDFSPQNVNFAIKADYINNLLMVTEGCTEMRENTDTQMYNAKDIMATWRDSVVLVICE
jgi:S1-C subfamily serine protease